MTGYIDSSVLLRLVLNEPNPLENYSKISKGVSSELIRVECLRTLDRYRILNQESEDIYFKRVELLHDAFRKIDFIPVVPDILFRAGQPFPTQIGTLDALHLSSCLAYQEHVLGQDDSIVMCTHDDGLKRATLALGLQVLG